MNEETRKQLSIKARQRWADPNFRNATCQAMSEAAKRRWSNKPSGFDKLFPNGFGSAVSAARLTSQSRRHGLTLEDYAKLSKREKARLTLDLVPPPRKSDQSNADFVGVTLEQWRNMTGRQRNALKQEAKRNGKS